MKIVPADINGVVGIVPTPATPDADKWTSTSTINRAETAKMIQAVQVPGINILMTTGTFGECSSLLEEEVLDFVDVIVQTNQKRKPLFIGVTTLNTRETVARGRAILDKFPDVDGLFLGRPMWLPLDDAGIVQYYRDLAEAFEGVPLIAYDNPMAFKGKMSTDVYRALANIPELVCTKHTGGPALAGDVAAVGDKMRILPIDTAWIEPAQQFPDRVTASWSGNVACCPAPIGALALAIEKRDWTRAKTIAERLSWAASAQFPEGDLAKFMPYSIQIGHGRFKGAGLIDPGPARPPYVDAPEEFVAAGIEAGRRMREVQEEYAQSPELLTA
ncbi:dihydrodipicolinate synthase family protein [Actibacterium sp. D379-3]